MPDKDHRKDFPNDNCLVRCLKYEREFSYYCPKQFETKNDEFEDKYFAGITIDLSKVLFIFSYNDPSLIDKILLDRIHRIKFDHLTVSDKLTITRKHILPEIMNKMGLDNSILIEDDVIEYIIKEYTYEAGVRKLKEMLCLFMKPK